MMMMMMIMMKYTYMKIKAYKAELIFKIFTKAYKILLAVAFTC